MAGLDRDLNMEAKYLKKVLSQVDERIVVPQSLRGDVLRHKIELIEPDPEPVTTVTLLKPKRWPTWQLGLTYAAGFALLVGLFYGLGFNDSPSILEGGIDLESDTAELTGNDNDAYYTEGAVEEGEAVPFHAAFVDEAPDTIEGNPGNRMDSPNVGGDAPQIMEGGGEAADSGTAVVQGESPPAVDTPIDAAVTEGETVADSADTAPEMAGNPMTGGAPASAPITMPGMDQGIGGPTDSVRLGQMNGYTLTYREKDKDDPDKQSYPLTLEVLSVSDDQVVSQYSLPLSNISYHCQLDDSLALVGSGGGSISIYILDLGDMSNPQQLNHYQQDGSYVSARLYEDYLHVASYTASAESVGCEIVELPDRVGGGACIITAVNLRSGEMAQKAFAGAKSADDIRLYNVSAYIGYDAEEEEGMLAQIVIKTTDMQIGSVA